MDDMSMPENIRCWTRRDVLQSTGAVWTLAPALAGCMEPPTDAESLPAVSRDELVQLGKQPVAEWLRCPRFFSKDNRRDTEQLDIRKPGDITRLVHRIADNGGTVYRQAVYWGGEVYYQSKVAAHRQGLGTLDYLREALDAARTRGVKVFAYMNPKCIYDDTPLYPECTIYAADGQPRDYWRGERNVRLSCINHPKFRQFLTEVLKEIFGEYGADGLYVDGLSCNLCLCEHCRERYRRMFEEEMPVKFEKYDPRLHNQWEMTSFPYLVGDPHDPDSAKLTRFLWESEREATEKVWKTVKQAKPDALAFFHNMPKPETVHLYDAALSEVYIKRPWVHTLWKHGELSNYSAVFPVPSVMNIYYQEMNSGDEIRHNMFQSLANGSFPNIFFHQIRDDDFTPARDVFEFMRINARYLDFARTRRVRWMAFVRALHCNSVLETIAREEGGQPPADLFLMPYVGLYAALLRRGLPVVTRQQPLFHEDLQGFRVLCLANEAAMSEEQIRAVRAFVEAGGGLVATGLTSLYDKRADRRTDFALADLFGVRFERLVSPGAGRMIAWQSGHPVTAGLTEALAYENESHPVVHCTTGTPVAWLHGPGIPDERVPAVVVHTFGRGRVVFLPGRLDAMQCRTLQPDFEILIDQAVRWVADEAPPVDAAVSAPVGVTLYEQSDCRILHLVNHNGIATETFQGLRPIMNLHLRMRIPENRRVTRLHRLRHPGEIPVHQNGDILEWTMDLIDEHETVVMELT